MDFTRRHVLALVAAGTVAGCSNGQPGGDDDDTGTDDSDSTTPSGQTAGGLTDGDPDGSAGTSLAGSCASNFGDTLQAYDTGDRGMVATFFYPMGGRITFEQTDSVGHVTAFGYGQGDISPLHSLTVSERGPFNTTGDATEAYEFDDRFESGTVTTFGGQDRPAAIRRTDDSSVTYIFRIEGPDGFYEFSVQTSVDEGEPCPDTYESVSRRVAESFEFVA